MAKTKLLLALILAFNASLVLADEPAKFYVFVSSSLAKETLNSVIQDATKYKTTLVFRGLPENSFKQTEEYLKTLDLEDREVSIIIDPNLFRKYEINSVPSYVLANDKSYDKLAGNVTAKFALEKFANSGDLSLEAKWLLDY